ncbi:MAG: hypothetical protein EB141_16540 [Verrucomicrobia bacterium]|nr:hypothetical protein [Verrucomicrobiota bacterium]NBU09543.1 hypothetical protein [Pseudomonadota bacterium]NDA68633.1 hypothetical protein [Verrucomicrobiota bacterium]NDB77221.1 hypothetical protein [Verrucomicrobiota bacterium]NDD40391.1 hypothetical protein [Verrucomicrobiota bacterium]
MKKQFWLLPALALGLALVVAQAAQPAPATAKPAAKPAPGMEVAQTITTVTGVAISPLLGTSAYGAWKWFRTDAAQRDKLPWFAQWWFWLPALGLVGAVALKDAGGVAVPTALKKPLDVAEALENKVSGLVAAGAFVPIVASVFGSDAVKEAIAHNVMFASLGVSGLFNVLMVPFAMMAFAVVWLAAHAINMLILISPFATVDAGLKAFRTFLLSTVTVTGFADPTVGAIWSIIIIIASYFLSGWAFRLTVCGTQFIWDYLTFGRTRFKPDPKGNAMFLARELNQVPIRTYGTLARNDAGELVFTYRPWLVLAPRQLVLPKANYAVGEGIFHSEIVAVNGDTHTVVFTLPPRYSTHEATLSQVYGWGATTHVGIIAGLKAIGRFIGELCGFSSRPALST